MGMMIHLEVAVIECNFMPEELELHLESFKNFSLTYLKENILLSITTSEGQHTKLRG